MKKQIRTLALAILMTGMLGLAGCGNNNQSTSSASSQSSTSEQSTTDHKQDNHKKQADHQTSNTQDDKLADLNYQSGQPAYINVNGGRSTLKAADWHKVHVDYANLDDLNRTSTGNTAYLDSQNVANDSLRQSQTVKPTGWHQKFVNNEAIINRGHLIAYSLSKGISASGEYNLNSQSGDQNNPKNLFTQTAFSNQKVQTIFETKVRNALRNGEKVIYQVKPIFKGDDLMAKGVQMQAISTDGQLNFNVYLFNVQPGIKFDYASGRSKIDHELQVPTPAGAPTFYDHKSNYHNGEHYESNHHHWLRDYFIYRGVRHAIDRHYEHKHYREGYRSGFHESYHHFGGFQHRR